jgi:hypothetical protein
VGEANDGNLERDPGVDGIAHRHQRRSQYLHGADAARGPEEETLSAA